MTQLTSALLLPAYYNFHNEGEPFPVPRVEVALAEVLNGHDEGVESNANHDEQVEPLVLCQPEAPATQQVFFRSQALKGAETLHDELRLDPRFLLLRDKRAVVVGLGLHLKKWGFEAVRRALVKERRGRALHLAYHGSQSKGGRYCYPR